MATCSCGQSHFDELGVWQIGSTGFLPEDRELYCAYCGDKLLPTGTVEPRAELVPLAALKYATAGTRSGTRRLRC